MPKLIGLNGVGDPELCFLSRKTPSFLKSAPAIQSRRQSLSQLSSELSFTFAPHTRCVHYLVPKAKPQLGINTEWAICFFSLQFHTCLVVFAFFFFRRTQLTHHTVLPLAFYIAKSIHLRNPRSIGRAPSNFSFSLSVTKAILHFDHRQGRISLFPNETPFPIRLSSLLFSAGFPLRLQPIPLAAFPYLHISISQPPIQTPQSPQRFWRPPRFLQKVQLQKCPRAKTRRDYP